MYYHRLSGPPLRIDKPRHSVAVGPSVRLDVCDLYDCDCLIRLFHPIPSFTPTKPQQSNGHYPVDGTHFDVSFPSAEAASKFAEEMQSQQKEAIPQHNPGTPAPDGSTSATGMPGGGYHAGAAHL